MLFQRIEDIKDFVREAKKQNKTIGFVPTMGYLHRGHLSLIEKARQQCDVVIASIFVNPIQFGAGEDFEQYPRDLTRDLELAKSVGVDAVFAPEVKEMYPQGFATFIDLEKITEPLCGRSRPGHFRGVATVVTKLFNIVEADFAFFGQKDAQQVVIIRKMVADLNMNLQIVTAPIVREEDGLAMSSRNVYLNPDERKAALVLSRSLEKARETIERGERNPSSLQMLTTGMINKEPLAKIDYVEILGLPNLEPMDKLEGEFLIALAVRFGNTRLIDNLVMEV